MRREKRGKGVEVRNEKEENWRGGGERDGREMNVRISMVVGSGIRNQHET